MGKRPLFFTAYDQYAESERKMGKLSLEYVKKQLLKQPEHAISFGGREVAALTDNGRCLVTKVYLLNVHGWRVMVDTTNKAGFRAEYMPAFYGYMLAVGVYAITHGMDDNEIPF